MYIVLQKKFNNNFATQITVILAFVFLTLIWNGFAMIQYFFADTFCLKCFLCDFISIMPVILIVFALANVLNSVKQVLKF